MAQYAAGWYPDPEGHAEYRWWDGTRWTDQVADHGAIHADTSAGPAPDRAALAGVGAAVPGALAGLGPGGWQVVVGRTLPGFAAVGGRAGALGSVRRVLGHPAVATGVAAAASLVPATLSDVDDAQAFLPVRFGVSILAVVVAAMASRLPARLRPVAVVVPALFALVQGAAVVPLVSGWRDGAVGAGTLVPFLVSAVAGVVVGLATAWSARRGVRAQAPPQVRGAS